MGYIKTRPCTTEGCNNPRFSKGLCKNCYNKQFGKAIKKQSEKGKLKAKKKKGLIQDDISFYISLWNGLDYSNHVCNECKVHLGSEPLLYMFDHILEKSKYPQFRHEQLNIQLLCLSCHDCKTRGILSKHMQEVITNTRRCLLNE